MSVLTPVDLGDKVWVFNAPRAEIVVWDDSHERYESTGEVEDLGKVRARCVELRWTRKGALRVFRVEGEGKFAPCFQTLKLPRTMRTGAKPAKKKAKSS